MANPALVKMLSYSTFEELSARNLEEEGFEPTYQRKQFVDKIEKEGEVRALESAWNCRDGKVIFVRESAHAVRDEKGNTLYYDGTVEDITERKRAEEAVRESEERFRMVFENVFDGISIYNEDPDPSKRRLVECNERYAAMAGRSREELTQLGSTQGLQITIEDTANDNRLESLARGTAFQGSFSWIRPDGKDNIVEYVGVPITWRGKSHSIGIDRDITVRKLAEEALKKSEEQYRHFFDEDLTGDYISTPEGKILSCNPAFARIFGFASIEEALNTNASDLQSEPENWEIYLRLLKERRKLEYYESEYLRRDGTRAYCVENAIGIFDPQGNLVQIRGYIFDDTKRKNLERQLIQAQKLESLGTLASGIAHDFNNILGIILGYATLLTRQKPDPENIKISADAVIRASQRGAALVKQLLTFARKVDVQLQSVRLNDLVNEISQLLSETMAKTVEISLHLDEDLPAITGDPSQIHQVLLNLCVNARDAMPKGGTIGITTCCQQGETIREKFPGAVASKYVVLRVADTGIGMDKRTQSRIFEPFFTTKGVGKGTGLGLSVVFGILESHDGFVDVESEPDKGTTFHLYFPVLQPVDLEQAKAEIQQVIPGGNETILVVEDEEMLTRLLRTSLQAAGYTVLIAVDGQEAVDLFDQHQDEIQLVLSDVGLPKLTGYDVFRKMKRTKPNLKFILASGFIEPQLKSEILKEGVRDFVQKPYSVYEVLKAIRTILDQK
jgi:PAS domain S-box-containing protein